LAVDFLRGGFFILLKLMEWELERDEESQ